MIDNTTTYKFAGVSTSITGQNKYAEQLKEYFSEAQTTLEEPISIIIQVCDSIKDLSFSEEKVYYAEGKGLQISNSGFIMNSGRCHYRVDNLFVENEPVSIKLYYQERHGVRKMMKTMMAYVDPYAIGSEHEVDRFISDTLNYSAFWWILALAFLKYDRAFVHSGMAAKSNMGVVFAGTGGCGKTSAISEMLNDGWKYVAEDFGIISADGTIWEIPKRGAISAEDVSYGSERLITLINQLSVQKTIRWKYFTMKKMNPLLSPALDELYGKENIEKKAKLWKVVSVVRSSTKSISEKKVSVDDIAERIMGASFRVIREMYNVLHNLYAIADEQCKESFPTMSVIENQYCNIIKKSLENAEYSVLEVPLKVNPKMIKEFVLQDFSEK